MAKCETQPQIASLRAPISYSDRTVEVDPDKGIIKNVSLMTVGPALGWPFDLDQTSIDQLASLASAQPDGVKSRFGHPELIRGEDGSERMGDDLGTAIGRIKNTKVVNAQARGDIYLGNYAKNTPTYGNLWAYLTDFAKEDPSGIGMSAVFKFETEPKFDDRGVVVANMARLISLESIDVVSQPAANPSGLLSVKPPEIVAPNDAPKYLRELATLGTIMLPDLMTDNFENPVIIRGHLKSLCKAGLASCQKGYYFATAKGLALLRK